MTDKKSLTISSVVFEFPKGMTLSDVIKELQHEDCTHYDDKLITNMRIEFSTVSEEEYNEIKGSFCEVVIITRFHD